VDQQLVNLAFAAGLVAALNPVGKQPDVAVADGCGDGPCVIGMRAPGI
jgi:hypothetical protein